MSIHLKFSIAIITFSLAISSFLIMEALAAPSQEIMEAAQSELGCTSAKGCKSYCNDPKNKNNCNAFACRHSMKQCIPPAELSEIRAIFKKELGCELEECEKMCSTINLSDLSVNEKCMDIGSRYAKRLKLPRRFINEGRKLLSLIKTKGPGVVPAGCVVNGKLSHKVCPRYCMKNMDKCKDFILAADIMPKEEFEMAALVSKKFNCDSPTTCEAKMHNNPEMADQMIELMQKRGMNVRKFMSVEHKQVLKENIKQLKAASPKVQNCLRERISNLDEILSGQKIPGRTIANIAHECFKKDFTGRERDPGEEDISSEMMGKEMNREKVIPEEVMERFKKLIPRGVDASKEFKRGLKAAPLPQKFKRRIKASEFTPSSKDIEDMKNKFKVKEPPTDQEVKQTAPKTFQSPSSYSY